jgi:hypothetical protein
MTAGRAALIGLIDHYALPWYRVTLLEIQNLAYFLQPVGEPLKLDFVKGNTGPTPRIVITSSSSSKDTSYEAMAIAAALLPFSLFPVRAKRPQDFSPPIPIPRAG